MKDGDPGSVIALEFCLFLKNKVSFPGSSRTDKSEICVPMTTKDMFLPVVFAGAL